MQVYRIRQGAFSEIRKESLRKALPLSLLAVAVGVSIGLRDADSLETVLPIAIPFVLCAVAFGMVKGLNRQKTILESYTLSVGNESITREQHNTPTIHLRFTDITHVAEGRKGGFIIRGQGSADTILVPRQIENYGELRETLQRITPPHQKPVFNPFEKYSVLITLLNVGLMVTVYLATDKLLVGVSGTLFLVLQGWSLSEINRNKNVDQKTKRSLWWSLLVLFSVVAIMAFKLLGT